MGLLKLENISKRFSSGWCLDIKSLLIEPGKTYIVYGPNGCGKTTLLNIMALLLKPDNGMAYLSGSKVNYKNSNLHRHRRRVSLVMQKGLLFKGTAIDNIKYGLKFRNITETEKKINIDKYAKLLGIENLLNRDVKSLSGGERQRVMFARAMVLDVDLLLLDEVMSGIDVEYEQIVWSVIKEYVAQKTKSVVMSTHDLNKAKYYSDKIFYMDEGKIKLN